MSLVDKIIAYEQGDLSFNETIEFFQELINTGQAWQLQGSYGRTAMWMVEEGYCYLPSDTEEEYETQDA